MRVNAHIVAPIALAVLLSFPANSELRHYVASLDESTWMLSRSTPIECRLEHEIPAYGKAVFTSQASKELNLLFTLDMLNKPDEATKAKLMSRPPSWRPGLQPKQISQLTYHRYFNGEVPKTAAWNMLTELERGMEPTFYYADWHNDNNNVAVGLSAANFKYKYRQFKQCLAGLLPYSFDDIAFTVLNYEFDSTELNAFSKQQLARIEEYLKHDPKVDLVLVDAYTDSFGGRGINDNVSVSRASTVKKFFVAQGIEAKRISTLGHGERRHVANNDSSEERARNRRVVIRISKP
ncbi:OmpA family protein [Shewanella sp. SNU WT4]|uniref:flagellar protein MotY n=1 Tax=Shewanella sp. SNU WT4 TaxID=2590015 RepID=UPI0011277BA3|nr:OmpA family protein [Shewanella sp. SNU WT4]QDF67344.1 OmpA family protein [Shewanella sp. SNU WT4]